MAIRIWFNAPNENRRVEVNIPALRRRFTPYRFMRVSRQTTRRRFIQEGKIHYWQLEGDVVYDSRDRGI